MTLQAPKIVLSFNFCFLIQLSLKIIFKNECILNEILHTSVNMKCQIVQFPFHVLMSFLQTSHQCGNGKMKTGQIAASDGGIIKKLTHTTGFKVHLTLL